MDITEYRKGCSETVPGLTGLRLPVSQGSEELGPGLTAAVSVEMLSLEDEVRVPEIPRAELQRKQKEDEVVGPAYRAVLSGRRPGMKE